MKCPKCGALMRFPSGFWKCPKCGYGFDKIKGYDEILEVIQNSKKVDTTKFDEFDELEFYIRIFEKIQEIVGE